MRKVQYAAVLFVFVLLIVGVVVPGEASAHRRRRPHHQQCQPVEDSRDGARFQQKRWGQNECPEEPTEVTPTPVSFSDPGCGQLGNYTIPTTEGVNYLVDGVVTSAGIYTTADGTMVTITTEASSESYFIPEGAVTTWTNIFNAATNCDPVVTPAVAQVSVTPKGGVSAGGGGAAESSTTAVAGMIVSVSTLALGFVARRSWNV